MCSVFTKMSQHQSQLWQGSVVVPKMELRREEGPFPPLMFPVGLGERLSSHGQNRQEEVYLKIPFLGVRQPFLYHIPQITPHSTGVPGAGSAGPRDEDTRSAELISQSWKSKKPQSNNLIGCSCKHPCALACPASAA